MCILTGYQVLLTDGVLYHNGRSHLHGRLRLLFVGVLVVSSGKAFVDTVVDLL